MRIFRLLAPLALFSALFASAQTYQPKAIRLQGADALDRAEVMHLVDLPQGSPLTKQQIEAAMQRLADSGLFSDLGYTVGPDALVITVTPIAGAGALTVRYGNFVWWGPGELEPLVEARVPLFHGKLPLTGKLTDEVEAALTALLAQKGVNNAHVAAHLSTMHDGASTSGVSGIILSVTQPPVNLGEIHLTGVTPAASDQVKRIVARLSNAEFDTLQSSLAITNNTADAHRNVGFLDVVVDQPTFSAPHKDMLGYAVDASAAVHPGELYRIAEIRIEGAPAGSEEQMAKAIELKKGDAAGEMNVKIAEGQAARLLSNRGMLDATAKAEVSKDATAHTASYRFQLVPGPVYTFAGLDTSALPPNLQSSFASGFHLQTGIVADAAVEAEISHVLRSSGAHGVAIHVRRDATSHTANYLLTQSSPASAGMR